MINSFKKHVIDLNENIDKDEKMLLWNKLFLNNNIYVKNKKNEQGEYLYPCIFKEYINTETVKLVFEIDINKEFERNKEINCNMNNLNLVPEFVYNYFIIKIKNNQQTMNCKNVKDDNNNSSDKYDYMEFNLIIWIT